MLLMVHSHLQYTATHRTTHLQRPNDLLEALPADRQQPDLPAGQHVGGALGVGQQRALAKVLPRRQPQHLLRIAQDAHSVISNSPHIILLLHTVVAACTTIAFLCPTSLSDSTSDKGFIDAACNLPLESR